MKNKNSGTCSFWNTISSEISYPFYMEDSVIEGTSLAISMQVQGYRW